MPVLIKKDENGSYAQWGSKTKYYFNPKIKGSKERAIEKARKQGIAININDGK